MKISFNVDNGTKKEKIAFLSSVREKDSQKIDRSIFGIEIRKKISFLERWNVRRRYFIAKNQSSL